MIEYKTGNLLDFPADVYVNTVNCVGVAGKGVALAFKKKYPIWYEDYRRRCEDHTLKPGQAYGKVLETGEAIVELVTKNHWKHPSKYQWVESAIKRLNNVLGYQKKELVVAMPFPGCGNGGLDKEKVKVMIEKYLGNLPHKIYVFDLPTTV